MAQLPRDKIEFRDFTGLASNIDPDDLGPGAAQDQINCCCIRQGILSTRRGYQEVTFEE